MQGESTVTAGVGAVNELRVGAVLRGYCGGCFGRDSYEDKRIEALGHDWVVVRGIETGHPDFASRPDGSSIDEKLREYVAP